MQEEILERLEKLRGEATPNQELDMNGYPLWPDGKIIDLDDLDAAIADIRAELADRDAKLRELDAWLTKQFAYQPGDRWRGAKMFAYSCVVEKLRELGLIVEVK